MVEKKQITAKDLQDRYEKDMKDLQRSCEHKTVSDWLAVREMHGNDTGVRVKQCKICWLKLEYKAICEACHKEFTYVKRDWTTSQLCPDCLKIGKYYCYQHKQLHNTPRGCPICMKRFERLEKSDKWEKKSAIKKLHKTLRKVD